LTPVQGAAVREFLVAVVLILMLRYRPSGLVPETMPRLPVPPAQGAHQPTA
jgi:hypothetical protein